MSKVLAILILAALLGSFVYSGPVLIGDFNPTLTVRQSSEPHHFEAEGQIPVVFRFGTISVPKIYWHTGLHAHAYRQMTYLYPSYRNLAIRSCAYTVYGPSRIYLYELLNNNGQIIKVTSSVQNNDEATGQQTQEAVQQQSTAELEAEQYNDLIKSTIGQEQSYFSVIKLSRAYEIPRVALALKYVTRSNWYAIRFAPLVRCLERWENGVYRFRFYFNGVSRHFEYTRNSRYESHDSEYEHIVKTQLRIEPKEPRQIEVEVQDRSDDRDYLPIRRPIFTVTSNNDYRAYTVADFRRHPGYRQISARCNEHFGRFDERWIDRIQYRQDANNHYFQIKIKFTPFLVDVDLEAHYYGSTEKASILKIDERVFNGKDNSKYFNTWNQIEDFNSYKAFRETNEYVLSEFTYLRHYKVTAAYSSLYKSGRYVRLVYESENNLFSTRGENQFNMIVYIVDGKFYIDRNDFHATNTYSFGKNDWLSLFVKVSDVNTHEAYHRIVKFFMTNHLEFWHAHRIEELSFKDGLHVVKFRNPSNAVKVEQTVAVVDVKPTYVKLLNHHDWQKVDEKSIHHTKAIAYIKGKYEVSVPMFVNRHLSPYGQHFEVSYLNNKEVYANTYLTYLENEDVFVEDKWKGIAYGINFDEIALPSDPETSLIDYLLENDKEVIAVVEVKVVQKNAYECVAVTPSNRWRVVINWVRGSWVVNQRTIVNDGYYFTTGVPSVHAASCTGYLARLYPTAFQTSWVYGSIEVKNIGYFIYNRVIYRVGSNAFQGVIRTTHGVENSHTLISWDKVRHIVNRADYGYGAFVDWNYGYNNRFFFDYPTVVAVPSVKVDVKVVVKDNDLLCSYFDDGKCLACIGDYYADNSGRCVRIEDECEYWRISGNCSRCANGWAVNSVGKCVAKNTVGIAYSF